MVSKVVLLLGLVGLVGCGSSISDGEGGGGEGGAPPSVECDAPSDPGPFELGTGERCFERVGSGDSVPMMNGPQGGYHMFLSVGCEGCPEEAMLRYSVLDPATREVIDRTYPDSLAYVSFVDVDGWKQAAGIQLGMPGITWDIENDPPLAEGTELLFVVELLDAQTEAILHESELHIVTGPITPWDPCDLNPDGECCGGLCN
jgi:hypothetical protein